MAGLSEDQRMHLHVVELWNCRNAFDLVCPRYFTDLEPTDDPEVGPCKVCQERVYQCRTPLDFVTHGELGRCVATPATFDPMGAFCTEMLGRPSRADIKENERHVQAVRAWWLGVLAEGPHFAPEAIAELARIFGHGPSCPPRQ